MGFITRYWKNAALEPGRRCAWGWLLCVMLWQASLAGAAELGQLRTERSDDSVFLTASVKFELPAVVEEALLKGIPLFFVVEADIYRDRWYWMDKRVAGAARTIRLAYQPLTRRWRVNIAAGHSNSAQGGRATLNQNYDTLAEALSAIERVARWKIAEPGEVEPGSPHTLDFRFRLDLTQLPRPFQIGVAGQRDWAIAVELTQRLRLETPRSAEGKEPLSEK